MDQMLKVDEWLPILDQLSQEIVSFDGNFNFVHLDGIRFEIKALSCLLRTEKAIQDHDFKSSSMFLYLGQETIKKWGNDSLLYFWHCRFARLLHQKMEIYFWIPLSKFLSPDFQDAESLVRNS